MKTSLLYTILLALVISTASYAGTPQEGNAQKNQGDFRAFSVYPNPATSVLYISFSNTTPNAVLKVSIVDMTGKEVMSLQSKPLENGTVLFPVDVSELPRGIYFAEILVDQMKTTRRITVTY